MGEERSLKTISRCLTRLSSLRILVPSQPIWPTSMEDDMKPWIAFLLVIGVTVALVTACAAPAATPSVAPTGATAIISTAVAPAPTAVPPSPPSPTPAPKVLTIASSMDLTSLDPSREFSNTYPIIMNAIGDTLVDIDPNDPSKEVPRLAESWTVNDDSTEFTFKIRQGVKFHTGNPLTARDVQFSLDRLKNVQGPPAYFLDGVSSIDVIDDQTVKITLTAPDSSFLAKMTTFGAAIYDSQVCQQNGCVADESAADTDNAQDWFSSNDIFTGPYELDSWVRNQEIRLKPNPDYWGATPAFFDEIVMRDIKDVTTQRQLVESGDVDLALDIDPDTAVSMKGETGINVSILPAYDLIYLALTNNPDVNKALANPKVHRAIQLAIDYEGITQQIGRGAQRPGAVIPLGFAGADAIQPVNQDVAAAKQLMGEAGYPNGFAVDVTYLEGSTYSIDMSTLWAKLQSDLAAINIKVNLKPATFDVWAAQFRAGESPMTTGFWSPDWADTSDYVGTFGVPDGLVCKRIGLKLTQLEPMFSQALAEPDPAKRAAIYTEAGTIMRDDASLIALLQPNRIFVTRDNIKNVMYSLNKTLDVVAITEQ
jgi:peptide/nickel transport system substrate-binding protein